MDEILKRFWAKVRKTDRCWLWTASTRNKGYGAFGYTLNGETVQDRAHRFSYRLHKGEIPDGMVVCHTCDTPACVNPDHLFLGTKADNNKDMTEKGRRIPGGTHCGDSGQWIRGEAHHGAKMNKESVLEIRALYATGHWSYSKLAKKFNINISAVSKIVTRKHWKHI